jgi:hypothetical protein
MDSIKPSLMIGLMLLLLVVWASSTLAEMHLQYRSRGNRFEGVRPKPVSGYDIELISARVDYKEEGNRMPERFKVKVYLEQPSQVHVTVRELDYKYYYWMDKVQPAEPWRPGFDNVFDWPTRDVIQQLGEISMYDLGVVARLENTDPSIVERVAPVIFYHSQVPANVQGYVFTFKTNGDARLTCEVYEEEGVKPVFTHHIHRQPGGSAFTVRWDSSQAAEGGYRLLVRGFFVEDNRRINQTVSFYHQPAVR